MVTLTAILTAAVHGIPNGLSEARYVTAEALHLGSAPDIRLTLLSSSDALLGTFHLRPDRSLFGAGTVVRFQGSEVEPLPDALGVYGSDTADGGWIRVTAVPARCGDLWPSDIVVFSPGDEELYTFSVFGSNACLPRRAVNVTALTDEEDEPSARALARSLGLPTRQEKELRRGRRAQLTHGPPPYSRLPKCPPPPQVYELRIGILLDAGFVAARGGHSAALRAASACVSHANAIFVQQLGVRLVVKEVILNEVSGGDFTSTGPNEAPIGGVGTRTCPGYAARAVNGGGASVLFDEVEYALGRLAEWVSVHGTPSPSIGLYHLFTDCFPPEGTVGLAALGAVCKAGRAVRYEDCGTACCSTGGKPIDGSANCASGVVQSTACTGASCEADAGLSSNSAQLWRTFAHGELGTPHSRLTPVHPPLVSGCGHARPRLGARL